MPVPASHPGLPDFGGWVKATTFGWFLGFVVTVLLALAFDALAQVGEAQFMVGVGMGAGVGLLQDRRIGPWLGSRHQWLIASTVGMGAPFVVGDVGSALGIGIPFSLALYVAVGSLLTGVLQWRLLRRQARGAGWWVPASLAGWMAPAGLLAAQDRELVAGIAGTTMGLIGMFLGGLLLGAVTGGVLHRLRADDGA